MNLKTTKSKQTFNIVMNPYRRKGAKRNRRKQSNRAESAITEILNHEPMLHGNIDNIGRNQIIGFWRRHEHLAQKTRMAYWYALSHFFDGMGKNTPPKPKLII